MWIGPKTSAGSLMLSRACEKHLINATRLERPMDIVGFMEGYGPVQQALIAGLFTWFMTAAGAALVIFFKELDRKVLDAMLGFAFHLQTLFSLADQDLVDPCICFATSDLFFYFC